MLSIKGTVWRTSRQVHLLCRFKRHLAGLRHLGGIYRWLATPKRAGYIAFLRLKNNNTQLHKKKLEKLLKNLVYQLNSAFELCVGTTDTFVSSEFEVLFHVFFPSSKASNVSELGSCFFASNPLST